MRNRIIVIALLAVGALLAASVNGYLDFVLRAAPSNPASGSARIYVDSSTNVLTCLLHSGTSCMPSNTGTATIASGAAALGTSAIASGACASVVTVSATGVASTDAIIATPNASLSSVTGYSAATTGGLEIRPYPTANNINFDVCNWASGSITPGAVVLNWRVVR